MRRNRRDVGKLDANAPWHGRARSASGRSYSAQGNLPERSRRPSQRLNAKTAVALMVSGAQQFRVDVAGRLVGQMGHAAPGRGAVGATAMNAALGMASIASRTTRCSVRDAPRHGQAKARARVSSSLHGGIRAATPAPCEQEMQAALGDAGLRLHARGDQKRRQQRWQLADGRVPAPVGPTTTRSSSRPASSRPLERFQSKAGRARASPGRQL